MSGMGGMDMSSAGMFTPTNKRIAHLYWYLVAAVVAVLVFRRIVDRLRLFLLSVTRSDIIFEADDFHSVRKHQQQPGVVPSRPDNILAQTYDTCVAICRELAYPQLWMWTGKFSRYFNPPPLGRCLLLLAYWAVILTMLWSNVILSPSSENYAYKWEIVGFRAAWVSVTQLPLIYILSGKANIITILTGISYERLNWLHRWVARTMFLTLIVHWSFFFTEWSIADFVSLELALMPMVKYGFGAWATLGWMVLTGLGFFRTLCYELWLLQHIAAAMVLLWLVHSHVPSYAQYNVWFAVGVVVFDRLVRTLRTVVVNLHLFSKRHESGTPGRRFGYETEVTALSHEFIHVKVRNVDLTWRPGQHVYLSIPRAGIFEAHPFTIASMPKSMSGKEGINDIELYLRVHNGFTKRLHRRCAANRTPTPFLSFLNGPWGVPPSLDRFETLILVATGNGASFTVPNLTSAVSKKNHLRQILFIWIIRDSEQLEWFQDQLLRSSALARDRHIAISILVYITGSTVSRSPSSSESNQSVEEVAFSTDMKEKDLGSENTTSSPVPHSPGAPDGKDQEGIVSLVSETSSSSESLNEKPSLIVAYGRPDFDHLIRPVVEEAWGETGILACGGNSFTGSLRNYVARLSDERAVHKGTGAQGIYLFCETYGW